MKRTVAANLTDLHAEPSWQAELLTQVTNGVELEIVEERGEWWRAQAIRRLRRLGLRALLDRLTAAAGDAHGLRADD
jgi:hypothetical protein